MSGALINPSSTCVKVWHPTEANPLLTESSEQLALTYNYINKIIPFFRILLVDENTCELSKLAGRSGVKRVKEESLTQSCNQWTVVEFPNISRTSVRGPDKTVWRVTHWHFPAWGTWKMYIQPGNNWNSYTVRSKLIISNNKKLTSKLS